MAKTRMKTTPTRMQKDALMASAATTVTVAMAGVGDIRKRLRHSGAPKDPLCATSTIIVAAPKRTNSISSAASSLSHASDTHSAHSDSDSPPPLPTTTPLAKAAAATSPATPVPRTLNNLLCKPSAAQIGALKNRKVYMITERCEEPGVESVAGNSAAGQKRKMYLIMEENSTDGGEGAEGAVDSTKYLKSEHGPKKLTLFADKSDVVLTQHFEKILPEILNRIQAKDGHINAAAASIMRTITSPPPPPPPPSTAPTLPVTATTATTTTTKLHNGVAATAIVSQDEVVVIDNNNKRLPITLPPKKNRTKIITTHINNSNCNNSATNSTGNGNSNSNNSYNAANSIKSDTNFSLPPVQIKQISAATPVIVSTASLPPTLTHIGAHSATTNNKYTHNGQTSTTPASASASAVQLAQPQKKINLSTDFLFLMKMLPKLESIPEPHKNNVKHYIEKIITQNVNIFAPH